MNYSHTVGLGDILYSWAYIKYQGGGALTLSHTAQPLARLAALQPYITSLTFSDPPQAAINSGACLNLRELIDRTTHVSPIIVTAYWVHTNKVFPGYSPWLEGVTPHVEETPYSVINVTHRYRDSAHIWGTVLPAGNMIFVGMHEEFTAFCRHLTATGYERTLSRIKWVHTGDLLAAAEIIAGATAFFGNASSCYVLAQGLGLKNIFVEVTSLSKTTCLFGHEKVLNPNV